MTADAKIGLLLGLVFIFIIAFIINGLPGLWGHPQSASGTSVASKQNENSSLAGSPQKPDWQTVLQRESVEVAPPKAAGTSTQDAIVAMGDASLGAPLGQNSLTPEPLSVASKTVDDVIKDLVSTPKPTAVSGEAVQPKPALLVDTAGLKTDKALAPGKSEKTTAPSPTPAPIAKKQAPREYQVQDGDTLATVAKKVYGSVDGNKLANVQRIFEFNRNTLKSADEITAGQKLNIPPLPATAPNPAKPEDVLPATHFETVPAIGKPSLADGKISQPQADGRWYVVQDSDNLWKIATSQLGNGSRFEEIAKLNAAILKSKDNLTVGMRLQMPAK